MTGLTISDTVDGVLTVELDRPPGNLFTVDLCRRLVRAARGPARRRARPPAAGAG